MFIIIHVINERITMKINVQYQIDPGTPITCEFNDFCNHAGAYWEEDAIDFGTFEEPRTYGCLLCDKCHAYNFNDTGWDY